MKVHDELALVGKLRAEIIPALEAEALRLDALAVKHNADTALSKRYGYKANAIRKVIDHHGEKLTSVRKLDEAQLAAQHVESLGFMHTVNAFEAEGWAIAAKMVKSYLPAK